MIPKVSHLMFVLNRCHSDEKEFLEKYPEAAKSYRGLVRTLQAEKDGRHSKNGTPEQRRENRDVDDNLSSSD